MNENITSQPPSMIFVGVTRLHYDSAGRLRSINPLMSSDEWLPFIEKSKSVTVLTRVEPNLVKDEGFLVDDRLKVIPIPYYSGIVDYYSKRRKIIRFISTYVKDPSKIFIIWVPNPLAGAISKRVKKIGAPLILRLIGDSAGVARAILPKPFNLLGATLQQLRTRRTTKRGDGIIYVTLSSLQRKYPARRGALEQVRTDIEFSDELRKIRARPKSAVGRTFSIIAVGSQHQNYKGHDLLINAIAGLQEKGYDVSLTLVGDGAQHESLRAQVERLGVDKVTFIKHLGSNIDVARYISHFDMFAMPSRTEGMPKALLEAMSVGVLSIGSAVGGIPELLETECLVERDSTTDLENKIKKFINDESLSNVQRQRQALKIDLIRQEYSGNAVIERFLDLFIDQKVTPVP